jgi:hypothetical protein
MTLLARLQDSGRLGGDAGAITDSWPDWLRAASRTAVQTFVAVFGLSLVGWLADVGAWAGSSEGTFPSISPLGKAVVAALVAASSGLVSALMNVFGKRSATYPTPPAPPG